MLSTLTNVQNSLFVPSLGRFLNRRPTYRLSNRPKEARTIDKLKASLKLISSSVEKGDERGSKSKLKGPQEPLPHVSTGPTASILGNSQYAVLPNGETLEGWTHKEKEELDDLVRHMLHSRRARFKRSMRGFGQYVRRRKFTPSLP
jgi:hypothetical protein